MGLLVAPALYADGPGDNLPDKVRRVPPPGIMVPAADRAELSASIQALGKEITDLRSALAAKPALLELLPDVQIYHNAVRYALEHQEFFKAQEIKAARGLLKQGMERARALANGQAPWTTATGLVVRGYVSRIDGSVQPYGLVVPTTYRADSAHQHRLDVWFHGRGETLSEVNFLDQRQRLPGEFTPRDAFVLHPYGRYCNANHFAGEIDTFEALANVRKHYRIDPDRISVRGFSMGGAACWNFAVHYPTMWAAAAPGAGFSETPDFLKVFQRETLKPTWYEQKLWHLYDCTDYAMNLTNCPTVAYSGEFDSQKQAADMMAKAMEAEGLSLVHIIGPKAKHFYVPQAREEINRRIDAIVAHGRQALPPRVRFTTWTLRYPDAAWVKVEGLEKHWERARVDARLNKGSLPYDVTVRALNVSALTLSMPPGACPLDMGRKVRVWIHDWEAKPRGVESIEAAPVLSDRSWTAHFRKIDGKWQAVASLDDGTLRKRPGLQGPIDDAFMDSFVMVRPTGQPMNDKVGAWAKAEMAHAIEHWRRQFRGEARVKNDTDVSAADITESNLVLWGDPSSNQMLARIAAKLPVRWDAQGVHVGVQRFAAGQHVPVLIYPNPLNPKKYVVLNSGFTFREYDYLNNARQVPKLPDFAVVDVNVPVTSRAPGGVVAAGFFDERWQLPASGGQ
jgi:pimeloyl-ACP methyl ester carboxylesterase